MSWACLGVFTLAGSGIGLTISKNLAGMLAGNIGLESDFDVGSTSWLDIPVTLAPEKNKAETKA